MQSLEIRKTHRYVGTCQHEDEWQDIGSFERLSSKELPLSAEDEEDPCEPHSIQHWLLVKANEGVTPEQIQQAIHDSFTQSGCHHEYDCCGCRSFSAHDVQHDGGRIWTVKVSSSRNF